jgi:flagellar protein FlgJ
VSGEVRLPTQGFGVSINPPLDIVLDVARAADPTRYRQAVERLTRTAPDAAAFEEMLDPARAVSASASPMAAPQGAVTSKPIPSDAAKAFQGFEAMALTTFVEAAFPDNASAVFGSGLAGGVWKSMLAEQMATQMARSGGIGIADQLASFAERTGMLADRPVAAGGSPLDPEMLVMTVERGFLGSIAPDDQTVDDLSNS